MADRRPNLLGCPNCDRVLTTKSGLANHLRRCLQARNEHPEQEQSECPDCQKRYPDKNSLAQHRRNFCRKDEDPSNLCGICDRRFGTYAGLQQHRRKAHPAAYQSQMESSNNRRNEPFSALERLEIAQAEVTYQGTQPINKYLSAKFECSVDKIRNLRKLRAYLQLRGQIETEQKEASDHPTGSPGRFNDLDDLDLQLARPALEQDNLPGPSRARRSTRSSATNSRRRSPSPPKSPSPPGSPDSPTPTPTASPTAQVNVISPRRSPAPPHSSPPAPNSPTTPDNQGDQDPVAAYLRQMAEDRQTSEEERTWINTILEDPADHRIIEAIYRSLWTPKTSATLPTQGTIPQQQGMAQAARHRRAHLYKRTQELYVKDRASLATSIHKGIEPGAMAASLEANVVREHYEGIFSTESAPDNGTITDPKEPVHNLYAPILLEHVRKAVADPKASNAAGPDGMSAADLRRIRARSVAILFNAMLYTGSIPSELKKCRTTLIPKSDADLQNISSWRPITVANILVRTMHRIIAGRMSVLPLHQSQRGFISLDGTMANAVILQSAIKTCRNNNKPYSIASLDLRKAFDTVPHTSIGRALERFRIDQRLKRFIMEGLTGCSTTIKAGKTSVPDIRINRGVKQGDPLSPLLFNLVLDEVLCRLDSLPTGLEINNARVNSLAYADDLLLLTSSPKELQIIVRITSKFFEARSMELNPTKCSSLVVKLLPKQKKLFLASSSKIFVGPTALPTVEADSSFKYLGHKYGFMGTDPPSTEDLQATLNNLLRAPLKPHQKLVILQDYLIPKFLFAFQSPRITSKILSRADKAIRKAVKRFLHLPAQTPNALLYGARKQGGLGLFCLSARIPDILLGRITRLERRIEDQQLIGAVTSEYTERVKARLDHMLQPFGKGKEQAAKWRTRLTESFSGAGLPEHCAHPGTSGWLKDPPKHWSGRDYIQALQLRTNTLPTTGGLHNSSQPAEAKFCRAGCRRVETLSHVLQRCPVTHHERIRRHDHAVQTFAKSCTNKGHTVSVEPSVRDSNGRLHKPDLIIKGQDGNISIIDVCVCWETPRPLQDHADSKVATYSSEPFLQAIREMHPSGQISVAGLALGARGTWCPSNDQILRRLNLPRGLVTALISGVLRGGTLIHGTFNVQVWDRRP